MHYETTFDEVSLELAFNRLIRQPMLVSTIVTALVPYVLGYVCSIPLMRCFGDNFEARHVFFIVGFFTALTASIAIASQFVRSLKLRHYIEKPIVRLTNVAEERLRVGSTKPFRVKARINEVNRLSDVFRTFFMCQDTCVEELVRLIHSLGHNIRCTLANIVEEANAADFGLFTHKESSDFARENVRAVSETVALFVSIADNYNRIKGPPPVSFVPSDVIGKTIERLRPLAEAKSLALDFTVTGTPCQVLAHPQKLDDIAHNLVHNAIKYTPNGGRVAVTLDQTEKGILLVVSDTGIGIPERELGRIFEADARASNVGEEEGRGLGLSFVRAESRFYGGDCTCQSTLGKGSAFSVMLPLKLLGLHENLWVSGGIGRSPN